MVVACHLKLQRWCNPSPHLVIILFFCLFSISEINAQDCASPVSLCGQGAPDSLNTADGAPPATIPGFCPEEAANYIFYEFSTLDINQFPSIAYEDSTATIEISSLLCADDPSLGQGVNLSVFTASDLCDQTTFNNPIYCDDDTITSPETIILEGLEPSTTYYIMVSGVFGDPPAVNASECAINLSISGPAVTYDLEADWFSEGNEDREPPILFEGETLVLTAGDNFPNTSWTGEALNSSNGSEVTANPEGVGESFVYTVTSEIDGCIYVDQVEVTIFPAVVPFNAFTPNGDGINDTWEIGNINEWPNAQIIVYSRWGQKVFQATNYDNDWDGDELPSATYYYVIELNPIEFNTDPYTGSVTIIR